MSLCRLLPLASCLLHWPASNDPTPPLLSHISCYVASNHILPQFPESHLTFCIWRLPSPRLTSTPFEMIPTTVPTSWLTHPDIRPPHPTYDFELVQPLCLDTNNHPTTCRIILQIEAEHGFHVVWLACGTIISKCGWRPMELAASASDPKILPPW